MDNNDSNRSLVTIIINKIKKYIEENNVEFKLNLGAVFMIAFFLIGGVIYERKYSEPTLSYNDVSSISESSDSSEISEADNSKAKEKDDPSSVKKTSATKKTTTAKVTTAKQTKAKTTTAAKTTTVKITTVKITTTKKTTTVKTEAEIEEPEIIIEYPIDINYVTYDELVAINGIGDHTANSILSYRDEHGKITSFEQLEEISGIGSATADLLKGYLYISEEDHVPYYKEDAPAESEPYEESEPRQTEVVTTTAPPATTTTVTTVTEEPHFEQVHINYADADELERCLLITHEQAEEIVELRDKIQYFTSITELLYIDSLSREQIYGFSEYVIID